MKTPNEDAPQTDETVVEDPHLDKALTDLDVPQFEEEIELWTTFGGD